jgi:hypothetical protein
MTSCSDRKLENAMTDRLREFGSRLKRVPYKVTGYMADREIDGKRVES